MGYNLGQNLLDKGHQVVAYDVSSEAMARFAATGGQIADSIPGILAKLEAPRVLWIMVPHAIIDEILGGLREHLQPGDIVIEAGNSHFKESIRRSEEVKELGAHYFDVGTSGGMEGARHGACYMIGGDKDVFSTIEPLFRDTAVENGYLYTGPSGSGHYAKMVHNGIEYGMMAAIGEGFEVLEQSPFDFDYEAVAKVWAHGSVIRGWLMDLTQRAFSKDPQLSEIRGVMHSSGEGKWTVEEALNLQVSTPVIAMSLLMRYQSLKEDTFTGKVVAALRNEFGGHSVEKK